MSKSKLGSEGREHLVGCAGGVVRSVQALDHDGQDALPVLAGGLGDQLLGPVPESGVRRAVVGQHQLVDAGQVGDTQQGTEPQPGVVGVVGLESRADRSGLVEEPRDVDAGESARHEPERGQRRVATAHVGVGAEDPVAGIGRGLVEGRGRVGHDHDPLARVDPGVGERLLVGASLAVGLHRAAGLARHDHDRLVEVGSPGRCGRSPGRRSRVRRARRRPPRRSPRERATNRPCRRARPGSAAVPGGRRRARGSRRPGAATRSRARPTTSAFRTPPRLPHPTGWRPGRRAGSRPCRPPGPRRRRRTPARRGSRRRARGRCP